MNALALKQDMRAYKQSLINSMAVDDARLSNEALSDILNGFTDRETVDNYYMFLCEINSHQHSRELKRYALRTDLYFMLWHGLNRRDAAKQWILERCKEVQASPDNHLDLWAREHYKSTIITYAKTIQDILASHGEQPLESWNGIEPTFGIFSCTRPLAKGFLRQIKREFESNETLKYLFDDVIWGNPHKDAPKWSEDDGLVLIRKSNPKESTIEAWGIVDGQPTSKHFDVCVYDDVVTIDNVRSPNMIAKTTEAWELSINLGSENGKRRYVGTRYHFNDTYRAMLARNAATARIYTATIDGTPSGKPALISAESLEEKRRLMGPYTFSCQMLQNPVADEAQGFKSSWLSHYETIIRDGMNVYIIVDPANEKKSTSDYTAMVVMGLGQDQNYYLLDMIRDRLNLTQRAESLLYLHKKWKPITVGYEKYGMQSDIDYIKVKMEKDNYRFNITEVGGNLSKNDRIRKLIPVFENRNFYLPISCNKTNYEGKTLDLVDAFIEEEYKAFPVCVHDDLFDAMARILDEKLVAKFPDAQVTYRPEVIRNYGGLV